MEQNCEKMGRRGSLYKAYPFKLWIVVALVYWGGLFFISQDFQAKAAGSKEQVVDILKLFAAVNHTKQINIGEFDKAILTFYNAPTLSEVAHTFHAKNWDYIKGHN